MLFEGQWIPVCYDGADKDNRRWSYQEAWVACRQLGYYGGRRKEYDGLSVENDFKAKDVRCNDGNAVNFMCKTFRFWGLPG